MNRPFILAISLALAACTGVREPADYVNVFNGTDFAGNTYPGATLPYGMVQLSPDTDNQCASGYHYSHNFILGYRLSGPGRLPGYARYRQSGSPAAGTRKRKCPSWLL